MASPVAWLGLLAGGAFAASVAALALQRKRTRMREQALQASLQAALIERDLASHVLAAQQDFAAVGSLTALVAHGANNRLTVILSCLDVIGSAGLHDQDSREALELANGAARRLADDMTALLAGVRRQSPQVCLVPLAEAVGTACDVFRRLPGAALEIAVTVPSCLEVPADPDRLVAALLRLLSFGRRRHATAIAVNGWTIDVKTRAAERPALREGRYCCLEFELVGASLTETLLRTHPEPGHVLERLLDADGLELAAVESFVAAQRGQLMVSGGAGANPRMQLVLPVAAVR
jgi:hypothetical protein